MCETQLFLLQKTNVHVSTSLQQWLLHGRVGWVCVSDLQALTIALDDTHQAADVRTKR
jgi:hypothetical protein